jgi:hypothetical protein
LIANSITISCLGDTHMAEDIDPSAPDLRIDPTDKRIDVGAKFALQRMLKVPDTAVDAARLIRGINGKTLAGIFGDDLAAAVKVAQAHGTQRWLLVPKGEDAALVLDAAAPLDAPPTIIFRGDTPDIRNKPARLDPALQKASRTFDLWQRRQIGPCAASASAVPVANLVPSSFCHLPAQDLLVVITEAGEPGSVLPGARVEVEGPSPSIEVKSKLTDAAGKAEFPDLATGSYQVRASKDRFQNASTQILLGSQPAAFSLAGDIGAPSAGAQTAGSNTVALQLSPQVTQLILIEHPDQNNAPALTDEARWGVVRKGGTPAGGGKRLPDIPAWQDVSVRVDRSPLQQPLLFPVDPDFRRRPAQRRDDDPQRRRPPGRYHLQRRPQGSDPLARYVGATSGFRRRRAGGAPHRAGQVLAVCRARSHRRQQPVDGDQQEGDRQGGRHRG